MTQQTSIEAYYSLKNLGDRQLMVYTALEVLKEACNLDIAEYLHKPINTVTPRTNELVKSGPVVEAEKKINLITHKKVIYWRIK